MSSSEEDSYESFLQWKRLRPKKARQPRRKEEVVKAAPAVAALPAPVEEVESLSNHTNQDESLVSPFASLAARVEQDARDAGLDISREFQEHQDAQKAQEERDAAAIAAVKKESVAEVVEKPKEDPVSEKPKEVAAVVESPKEPEKQKEPETVAVVAVPVSQTPIEQIKDDTSEDSAEGNKGKAEATATTAAVPLVATEKATESVTVGGAPVGELYNAPISEESEIAAAKAPFDGKQWTNAFHVARRDNDEARIAFLRRVVQRATLHVLANKAYEKQGREIKLLDPTDSIKRTIFYDGKSAFGSFVRSYQTTAHFVKADAVDVALFLMDRKNVNPVVLVMADENKPGGKYEEASCAQEESIFRRTTLRLNLEDPEHVDREREWKYPIPPFGGIYAPDVQVFRSSEGRGYEYLPLPKKLSFICASSLVRPSLVDKKKKGELLLNDDDAKATRKKIETILSIGLQNGHDAIVLSAFGCGYNKNPPSHIARLFREVITQQFPACYRHVTFAIIDDENTRLEHNPEGNIKAFQEEFLNMSSRNSSKVACTMF